MLRTLVKSGMSRLGCGGIRNDSARPDPLSFAQAIRRVARRVPEIETVVDVGASNGSWSRVVRESFPSASYLLIEANAVHEEALREYKAQTPRVDFVMAAAGDQVGELYFDGEDPLGGVASHEARPGMKRLAATTIDREIELRGLAPPYFIKLDTHGFELPILAGAAKTLSDAALLMIEAYNFQIEPDSLLFFELCAYLRERGFLPADLCDPLFRPRDEMLWQFDLLFMRADRPEFAYNKYR